mmetsp:Transcript_47709/g.132421  ORF Transcript_47709/g.132421 Transcript_47709/m.132421 type:complete len:160 (+) Transcript_47709:274-753(+)
MGFVFGRTPYMPTVVSHTDLNRTGIRHTGEWENIHGKRRKLCNRSDIEVFMAANDLEDLEMGAWGQFVSMALHPFWEPDRNHPAQQLPPPPPPQPATLPTDLIGRTVRGKFPGYGWYTGTVIRINDGGTKYVVEFEDYAEQCEYTEKKVRKMLQPVAVA